MTLIECFDRSPVDNIIGCLRLRPEKLVFLGEEKEMEKSVKRYRRFLKDRNMNTEVILQGVNMDDLDDIVHVLSGIVNRDTDCVIDLTGGDERIIMAVGAVLAGLDKERRKHVTAQRFDTEENTFSDCDGDGLVIPGFDAKLTTRELIALHGGIVHPSTEQPDKSYSPSMLDPFWELVCENPRDWNKNVAALNEFQSRSYSDYEVYVPLEPLSSVISNFREKKERVSRLLYAMKKAGMVKDESHSGAFHYRYTHPLPQLCLSKAGNVLELKTLLEARALKENGRPFFQDCMMGVSIDWDGIIYPASAHQAETRNEIDVILMHGTTPLFISCKNGTIDDVELYKLHTVATHFGGAYVKKMLIATEIPKKGDLPDYAFIKRAEDMGIHLVKEAATLSVQGWREELKKPFAE